MKKAGGLLGVVALGVYAGMSAERRIVGSTRSVPDPEAREPFFHLPADRVRTVFAEDGVALHVEEVGEPGSAVTVVFCHGYTQENAVWHYQRIAFAKDNPGLLVFWDQRSHGKSGRGAAETSTIDQLGRDLYDVLEATAPTGQVVLVGHSMGGMTIMALADQHPELFGDRIVGVALIGTSTGQLAQVTFGLPTSITPVTRKVLPYVTRGARSHPGRYERGRRLGTDLAFAATRRVAFGSGEVSPAHIAFVEKMLMATPVDVIAEFYDTFASHDKLKALDVLKAVPVLILVGSDDSLTPATHSAVMAEALPDAELVVVEGAGHMVQLERSSLVTLHLRNLLRRALT